jgi:hypothetical protein
MWKWIGNIQRGTYRQMGPLTIRNGHTTWFVDQHSDNGSGTLPDAHHVH